MRKEGNYRYKTERESFWGKDSDDGFQSRESGASLGSGKRNTFIVGECKEEGSDFVCGRK